MARKGLNGTLSYVASGKTRSFKVRVRGITYALNQIADQSQGRLNRVVYPRRLSQAPFSIQIDLNGHKEYRDFNNWMGGYSKYVLTTAYERSAVPQMSVSVPVRNFSRKGVLQGPIEWGDHLGSMLWSPTITFETTFEPGDSKPPRSQEDQYAATVASINDPTAEYYYPTGTQLSGSERPKTYAKVLDLDDLKAKATGSSRKQTGKRPPLNGAAQRDI